MACRRSKTFHFDSLVVTGATGYLGSNFLQQLLKQENLPKNIFLLDRNLKLDRLGDTIDEQSLLSTLHYYQSQIKQDQTRGFSEKSQTKTAIHGIEMDLEDQEMLDKFCKYLSEQILLDYSEFNDASDSFSIGTKLCLVHYAHLKNLEAEKIFFELIKNAMEKLYPLINVSLYVVYASSAAVYGEAVSIKLAPPAGNRSEIETVSQSGSPENVSNTEIFTQLADNAVTVMKNIPHVESEKCSPLNEYGKYKLALEEHLQKLFVKTLILRISNPYGKEPKIQGVRKVFAEKITKGMPLLINAPASSTESLCFDLSDAAWEAELASLPASIIRDCLHVDELTNYSLDLIINQADGVFNLSSAKETSIEQIVLETTQELLSLNKQKPSVSSEAPTKISLHYQGWKAGEIKHSVLDNSKLLRYLSMKQAA